MSLVFPEVGGSVADATKFSLLRQKAGISVEEIAQICGKSKRTIYRWENGQSHPEKLAIENLERIVTTQSFQTNASFQKFTFIDLFAGIGGLRLAFEPLGGKCIFTSEWNPYAQQTYRANFKVEDEIFGDITKIPTESIPKHDLLLAGFPCQPFSIAGVSKKNSLNRPHGFRCEAQGTLFFDVARVLEHHKPKAFLLENVKNLVNHDKGRTFEVIKRTLEEELGYHVQYRIIDAKSWVPQHRERIIIVGFREANGFNLDSLKIPDSLDGPRLSTILHPEDGTELINDNNKRYIEGSLGVTKEKYTLSDHLWNYLQAYAKKHREQGNGFGYGLFGPDDIARTLSARYYKDGSEILIRRQKGNPRRLTPRECSRLMGFDRSGKPEFVIPVSDTQAYKQFGNAVVVPAVEAVAKHMLPWIVPIQLGLTEVMRKRELTAIA
ncbi:DNA (cytosine-5-)-methyltransferase [Dehalogenimonas alkenigignens]|uniref:DNA (cytosine-5-)-methyltransferase n=1 Tax=Dehalogenimonas alkenigignens TaxID=1217799 RepID=UPI000D5871FF|nr:DNA (cytosine-5-)-methyltransferase [Dehalogenimonas alkenigignens]PVV83546.1 DNA (cytosine-5-)-methyltransferase [Dehalogenimonas alkenigignens]